MILKKKKSSMLNVLLVDDYKYLPEHWRQVQIH